MTMVTDEAKKLLREILFDPQATDLLVAKCRWERMSQHAILSEWGDPREWPDYRNLQK